MLAYLIVITGLAIAIKFKLLVGNKRVCRLHSLFFVENVYKKLLIYYLLMQIIIEKNIFICYNV